MKAIKNVNRANMATAVNAIIDAYAAAYFYFSFFFTKEKATFAASVS